MGHTCSGETHDENGEHDALNAEAGSVRVCGFGQAAHAVQQRGSRGALGRVVLGAVQRYLVRQPRPNPPLNNTHAQLHNVHATRSRTNQHNNHPNMSSR